MGVDDPPIDLVIFDLDGTLVEFRYPYIEARKSVLDLLASLGISFPADAVRRSIQDIFDEINLQVKKMGSLDLDNLMARVNDVIDIYEMEAATSTTLFEDTKYVLQSIKRLGLKIAIVTNNGKRATEFVLNRFDLRGFFDVVVTRNDGLRLKPYPDGIMWVMDKTGSTRDRTLFVGDSPIDVKAGKAAGVVVAVLKSSFFQSLGDFEIKPDYLLEHLSDLLSIIKRDSSSL